MKYTDMLTALFLCIPSYVLAEDVVPLNKDQPAPFAGFLIDRNKAEKIRMLDLDYQFELQKGTLLNNQLSLTQLQLKNDEEHIMLLNKKLLESQESGIFTKYGFFVGGVLTTILITYGVSRATK